MLKKCNICNTIYEIAEGNFFHCKREKDGYSQKCKICRSKNRKRTNQHIDNDGNLLCLVCKQYLSENKFDMNKNNHHRKYKDRRCKSCKSKQREKRRIYCRGNGTIERTLLERYLGVKERSKRNGLIVEIQKEDLFQLWIKQKGYCAISGIKMTHEIFKGRVFTNVSIDRIDSNKGYLKDNIQLVCMAINQMKSDMSMSELIYFCKNIVNNKLKYNKNQQQQLTIFK